MKYDPQKHHRRSIRLKGYDYTQAGAYFITICSNHREHVFGEIVNGELRCDAWGDIVRAEWFKTAELRPYVELHGDEFVIMPNHGHGIIWILENAGALRGIAPLHEKIKFPANRAEQRSAPTVKSGSLEAIVRAYKSAVTHAINGIDNTRGSVVWQRNYYEHIIRNDNELDAVANYIDCNPDNWQLDRDNAKNIRNLPVPESVSDYLQDVQEMMGGKINE